MKKYSLIFKLSFLSYIACIFVTPYITARTYADVIFFIFLFCCGYELLYLFYLRKKDNVSFGKALADLFRYGFLALFVWITLYKIYGVIFGVAIGRGFPPAYTTYYGVDSLKNDPFGTALFVILGLLNAVYNLVYSVISKRIERHT